MSQFVPSHFSEHYFTNLYTYSNFGAISNFKDYLSVIQWNSSQSANCIFICLYQLRIAVISLFVVNMLLLILFRILI